MSEDIYKTPSTEVEKSHDGFKCPSCGKEMLKGRVTSSGDIYWKNEGEREFLTTTRGEKISHSSLMSYPQVSGYRCKECDITILSE